MNFVLKKWYKVIASVLSGAINTIGLVLSFIGIVNGENSDKRILVFFTIFVAEIFLIISVIYSIISIIKDKSAQIKLGDKINEIERLQNANRIIYENNKSIITTYKDNTNILATKKDTYLDNNIRINELKGEMCSAEQQRKFDKLEEDAKERISLFVQEERRKEYLNFREVLIGEYNRFFGNITNILRRSVEEYLSAKNCPGNVSITVKQLETPISYSEIKNSKIPVFTAFRDYRTYYSKKRTETWKKRFSIDKNSGFSISIEKEYFIFNFIMKEDLEKGLYQNETVSFYEYYNSGVICTIHSCINGEKVLYGYLACDSLFDEKLKKKYGKNAYDWNVANLLMYAAHVIAMYLEEFLNIWNSYCVDFDKTSPIIAKEKNELIKKESSLKEQIAIQTQRLSAAKKNASKDYEAIEKLKYEIQKNQNELSRLNSNRFCNYMQKKVEKTRVKN